MKTSSKTCSLTFLVTFLTLLLIAGGSTAVVDPCFHYRPPLQQLQYAFKNERYSNDGIVKHFEYDAIITGTSMTQNFKSSEFDSLFSVQSIKVPFSGAGYKEINENLERALVANSDITLVLRGMDYDKLLLPADWSRYDESTYPTYLYDDKLLNDVNYLFNKSVFVENTLYTFYHTLSGKSTSTFDEYGSWMKGRTFGQETVLSTYDWSTELAQTMAPFTEDDRQSVYETITQNVTSLADQYPDVDFYLFITPYSICYFHELHQSGEFERQLAAERYAIELLLQHPNIHLFSFFTEFDMITNLDNYKDTTHYHENINSQILQWVQAGHGQLTTENYGEYCDQMYDFYSSYNYSTLTLH